MMDKALQIFTLLILFVTAHQMTASNSFDTRSETNLAEVTQETVTARNNETFNENEISVAIVVQWVRDNVVSSEIVHREDQFQIKITAIENKTNCNTYCRRPSLLVVVLVNVKSKTYSFGRIVTGQTLWLNISLVGGVNVYIQDPESTAKVTDTTTVNAVCFFDSTYGLPQIILDTDESSTFRIDTIVTPTAVSTSPCTYEFTSEPNVPSYIIMIIHVAVPSTKTQKSFLVSPPLTYNSGVHQMTVTARKKTPFCYFTDISCPEPELVVWVSATINYKTMGCSVTVTGGQTLGLNIDLSNGLKIYPQNPAFTSSAAGTASVNINFFYNPSNGLPSLNKSANNPTEVSLDVETTLFANSGGASNLGHRSRKIMFLLFCSLLPFY